jgi:anti-sigma regulatory factor (Ser/Thr protein kinase)
MAALTVPRSAAPEFSTLVVIDEQSEIGAARRAAMALGSAHGLESDAVGRLAIVVTEAATNIIRHVGDGVIVLRALGSGPTAAVEMLALDKGKGVGNIERAMSDGYSTAGTAGTGLGAMRRLANVFAIHSHRDLGTAILARIGDAPLTPAGASRRPQLDDRFGVVCVPLRGESECGDAWRIAAQRRHVSLMLVDGLGHGHGAAAAAASTTAVFEEVDEMLPAAALARFDAAARGTRGVALSFTRIDEETRTAHFSGVGNVDARVLIDGTSAGTHLAPQNGIVGHTMPTLRPLAAPWPVGARLVMHSDGISARWRIDAYPGLMAMHPALMAGVLYRDFARERDDATVLVFADRHAPERPGGEHP